jgi:glycerol kinase
MMQFQADVLGVPVRRPSMLETTAYGAAGLAGLAVGFWKTPDDFLSARRDDTLFHPEQGEDWRGTHLEGWRRALSATQTWATERT